MLSLLLLLSGAVPAPPDTLGYWQQAVAYDITATLDESTGVLSGRMRITYVNRSPDTLRDFYVHLYLNAFRPGSRWAAVDSIEGRVRFQRLADPDYGYERLTRATVMGAAAAPGYPFAPDSTVAHWRLPRPLAPGDSMVMELEWQTRPSTVARRQGRRGRRFDFAQWYPKVAVYDRLGWQAHPLYPAGEFYGEFATYDVALDLPMDQVIGATGVPVEGDPGWERARANPSAAIDYQRGFYDARRTTDGCGEVRPGRKCVRFRAEQVHDFAFSLNPYYRYEEGRYGDVVVRVLYLPGDTATWGKGVAVRRTEAALAWLDTLYGTFAWPQLTNVHRLDGGGTEFPMMVMNSNASQGLIIHEVGHNYTMGILANNEWREGWLDEGFTSFQSAWFAEARGDTTPWYARNERQMLNLDLDRWSEPVSRVSDQYRDFYTYNQMIYGKAQLLYSQLRYVVGDTVMRRILRTYYTRWKLKHVNEAAFREVAEEVSRRDLGWLFGAWLHGTPLIDYRLRAVSRRLSADGRWLTTVTIDRLGDGVMPVEIGDRDTIYSRTSGVGEREVVEFTSARRPGRLMLDPRAVVHDWNMLNNREKKWFGGGEVRLDDPTRQVTRRDKMVTGLLPLVWSNDPGGLTLALRSRSNYLGRFERNLSIVSLGVGDDATQRGGYYFRTANPVRNHMPRTQTAVATWWIEGRAGVAASLDRSLRRFPTIGADPHAGVDAIWMATTDVSYLDRRLWDDAGTVEVGPWFSTSFRKDSARIRARVSWRAGVLYRIPGIGIVSRNRYDFEAFSRASAEASVRAPFWLGTTLGVRVFGGAYFGDTPPPKQRRISIAGADPYETFTKPLLRTRGALFVRPDFHYQAPGGANLRGFSNAVGGRWAIAVNIEGTKPVLRRRQGILREVALLGFFDAGAVDTMAVSSSPPGRTYTTLYDGGIGVVTRQQVRDLAWTMRFELPVVVNRFDFAAHQRPGLARAAFRWQVSLEPSF